MEAFDENTAEITISAPQDAILASTSALNLFLAGIGSGKSHCIGLNTAEWIVNAPKIIQIIGANTYQQLSKSTLKRVFDVWKSVFGWVKGVDFVVDTIPPKHFTKYAADLKSYENTISFLNGAMLYTVSLDNYKAIDGTEAAMAHLDETKDTREEAVKDVISTRLRQPGLWVDSSKTVYFEEHHTAYLKSGKWKYGMRDGSRYLFDTATLEEIRSWNPLYVYTSPAKVEWLNEWFEISEKHPQINAKIFSKTDFFHYETPEMCIVISSTYHNEHNLPSSFISDLRNKYKGTPEKIELLIYASPLAKTGGEFAHQFNRTKHVKPDVFFKEGHTVHFTLDFNTAPYMTGLCAQLIDGEDGRKKLRIFREYCLSSPRNTTEDVCSALSSEYGDRMRGLFYYGDPSGKNRQTVTKAYANNFSVVAKMLKKFLNNGSDRVLPNHPAVLTSRDFLNNLLEGVYGIDVEISESCKNFIHDLEFAKEDPNGAMLKPKVKDKLTGQTYEKYGHCLDAFRYLIVALFKNLYDSLK